MQIVKPVDNTQNPQHENDFQFKEHEEVSQYQTKKSNYIYNEPPPAEYGYNPPGCFSKEPRCHQMTTETAVGASNQTCDKPSCSKLKTAESTIDQESSKSIRSAKTMSRSEDFSVTSDETNQADCSSPGRRTRKNWMRRGCCEKMTQNPFRFTKGCCCDWMKSWWWVAVILVILLVGLIVGTIIALVPATFK